jgi:ABC-type spermidine/putrescine transport system permease subunit II
MKRAFFEDVLKIAAAAAVIAVALPDASWAQTLKTSVDEVKTGMTNMPTVLSGLAYLAGGATMLHGAGLLKKHSDNPTQTPLAQGLTRLGIGGVIAALPVAMAWVSNSLKTEGGNTHFVPMSPIS